MQKKHAVFALVALASFSAIFGVASAYQWKGQSESGFASVHDEIKLIIESGTYEEFTALRETYDHNFMPCWIESEEDFALAQEMHERMEQNREQRGFGGKMHRQGAGMGMHAGCPMAGGA